MRNCERCGVSAHELLRFSLVVYHLPNPNEVKYEAHRCRDLCEDCVSALLGMVDTFGCHPSHTSNDGQQVANLNSTETGAKTQCYTKD
jgi:hypothetical protein